ncbi:MAG: 4Fe-4S binding protein [Endomicrobium sp.]|jgi:ferredoxin|nr:4Fe-4S binding protein [Endomicrobium sp.]
MKRKIIIINEEKCTGCALCVPACHENAIGIVNGKAKLLREDYCDGLGDCLPSCPVGAISFEEREAPAYNENEVKKNLSDNTETINDFSRLRQWPVQIKLVPANDPYFENADILIAADCSAFACGNFHNKYMKGKVTLIGCPKLDNIDYSEKLSVIIKNNNIKSITVVRMEVPCCAGIANAAIEAAGASNKNIKVQIITLSIDGKEI